MDTLPLPPRPDLAQYKKRAKDLVAAARSNDPGAVRDWAREWLGALATRLGVPINSFVESSFHRAVAQIEERVRETQRRGGGAFSLADAQLLVAQAHSFSNWAEFSSHVHRPFKGEPAGREFEAAADAIVSGDVAALGSLLRASPQLVRERSGRVHRATLLHYVAANGVEDYRQTTPPNAVAVAKLLLGAGAEVDAVAETYGGGSAQTTMNLLVSSAHPHRAGLQDALIEVLVDHGAAIDGLDGDGSPLMTALAFWYGNAAETLARRGARVDNVVSAAALGREDLVRQFVRDRATLASDVRFFETRWYQTPRDPRAHIEMAFASACHFTRAAVANFFLDIGVDLAARDRDDMTPLHWAAANGMMELMHELLKRGAPLEAKNTWGGTVLDSTVYFALFQPVHGVDYPVMLEALVAAGADVHVLRGYPPGHAIVEHLLLRHGGA